MVIKLYAVCGFSALSTYILKMEGRNLIVLQNISLCCCPSGLSAQVLEIKGGISLVVNLFPVYGFVVLSAQVFEILERNFNVC